LRTEIKYKAVNKERGSATVRGLAYIKYNSDEYATSPKWLRAKGYYPFVFKDRNSAVRYADRRILDVFKVRVKGRYRKKKLPPIFSYIDLSHGEMRPTFVVLPDNTEMWEYVKLLEEIK